jgi:hypothetical protein
VLNPIPWFLIGLPLVISCILMLFVTIFLWTPTISWPISFYRYIFQDFVGFWTSFSYSFTIQGRICQLIFSTLILTAPMFSLLTSLFPTIFPIWITFLIFSLAFIVWGYSGTQIIYLPYTPKNYYTIIHILISLLMAFFFILLSIKIMFFIDIVPWYIVFGPLYVALLLIPLFQFKLSYDLNRDNSSCCQFLIWSVIVTIFNILIISTLVLLILKIDVNLFLKIEYFASFLECDLYSDLHDGNIHNILLFDKRMYITYQQKLFQKPIYRSDLWCYKHFRNERIYCIIKLFVHYFLLINFQSKAHN